MSTIVSDKIDKFLREATNTAGDQGILRDTVGAYPPASFTQAAAIVTSNPHAEAYVSAAGASAAITAATYVNVLANATITDTGLTSIFTIDNTNKRLTYIGTPTEVFSVNVHLSMVSTKSNEIVRFRLAKNGVTDAKTEMARKLGTGSDEGMGGVAGAFSLATNDYIEVHATLDASTADTITINHCFMEILPTAPDDIAVQSILAVLRNIGAIAT